MNSILSFITNLLYLVPLKVRNFKNNNPGVQVLAAGATKARKLNTDTEPKYERGWITARRCALILATDGFHCGDWFIPLTSVEDASLHRISGGLLVKVDTKNEGSYQFGLQFDPAWEKQTLLPMRAEETILEFSLFSLIVRLIILFMIVWIVTQRLVNQQFSITTLLYILVVFWLVSPITKMVISKLKQ